MLACAKRVQRLKTTNFNNSRYSFPKKSVWGFFDTVFCPAPKTINRGDNETHSKTRSAFTPTCCLEWTHHPSFFNLVNRTHLVETKDSLYYQPKQCIVIREIPQKYNTFALIDSSKMGNLMIPACDSLLAKRETQSAFGLCDVLNWSKAMVAPACLSCWVQWLSSLVPWCVMA